MTGGRDADLADADPFRTMNDAAPTTADIDDDWLADDEEDWLAERPAGEVADAGTPTFDQDRYDPMYQLRYVWGAANAGWEPVDDPDELPADLYKILENKTGGVSPTGRIYAALLMWHTLTTDQIASMLDMPTGAVENRCDALAAIGAISRGRMTSLIKVRAPRVWSICHWDRAKAVLAAIAPETRLAVTAGTPVASQTPHAAYHNVYAAELALRAIEQITRVAVAFGPHLAHYRGMAGYEGGAYADGALVLDNGATIAVEVITSSHTKAMHDARDTRLKILSQRTGAETGLHVVYVGASRYHREHAGMLVKLRAAFQDTNRFYGPHAADALNRVFYAKWTDWFPSAHHSTAAFRTLRATRLIDGTEHDLVTFADVDFPARLKAPIVAAPYTAAAIVASSTNAVTYTVRGDLKPPAEAVAKWQAATLAEKTKRSAQSRGFWERSDARAAKSRALRKAALEERAARRRARHAT